jgi:hypothetical protein
VLENEFSLRILLIQLLVYMNDRLKQLVKFHPHATRQPAVSTMIALYCMVAMTVGLYLHIAYYHCYSKCIDVVWCDVVWCGVVCCGVVWCGVVWCGVVWCGVMWCGVVWCGVVCCGVVCCGVVCCGVVWCGVVWCDVV